MPVSKYKYDSGRVVWRYQFTLGATRKDQKLIQQMGFATKQEAMAAEATRRGGVLWLFEAFSKVGRLLKKLPYHCADFAALLAKIKKREKLQSQFQK